jgi:hypothetical protein
MSEIYYVRVRKWAELIRMQPDVAFLVTLAAGLTFALGGDVCVHRQAHFADAVFMR